MPFPPSFDARVASARALTRGVRELTFERIDGAPMTFEPGQWVNVLLPVDAPEAEIKRSYSIASAPDRSPRFDIAVTRVQGGPGSTFLHEVEPGVVLRFIGPQGFFTRAATGGPPSLMIAIVHPAKAGISSNLNLITDKGNIYSFTLTDVSTPPGEADPPPSLKVIVVPADRSSIVASDGPPQFVPAARTGEDRRNSLPPSKLTLRRPSMNTRAPIRYRSSSTTASMPTRRLSTSRPSITTTNSPISRPTRRKSSQSTTCATANRISSGAYSARKRDLHHSRSDAVRVCRTGQEADGFYAQGIMRGRICQNRL